MKERKQDFHTAITGEKIEPSKIRKDVSFKLGEPLSIKERQIYNALVKSGTEPISARKLYETVFDTNCSSKYDQGAIYYTYTYIDRIRKKLGKEAIVTQDGEGYISRRALIERQVKENMKIR